MTAPTDPTLPIAKPRSRRALLAGALGGIGAVAASAIGRASPVRATQGEPVVAGQENTANDVTTITNSTENGDAALRGQGTGSAAGLSGSSQSGVGVYGWSVAGPAVYGETTSGLAAIQGGSLAAIGVLGSSQDSIGVQGSSSSSDGVRGQAPGYGVHGISDSAGYGYAAGVYGEGVNTSGVRGRSTTAEGVLGVSTSGSGVYGESTSPTKSGVEGASHQGSGVMGAASGGQAGTPSASPYTGVFGWTDWHLSSSKGVIGSATAGVGLFGTATTGYALRTSGRLKADKVSGVATIPAGGTSVTVTPNVNVTSGSFVLLTPKANLGGRDLWFTTDATGDKFTIRMSSKRTSGTKVAWLLLG